MEKIKIADYKGHEIFYSEDEDKFICEIEMNEDFKKMKRVSLKSIKDEIDQFIKSNIGFVPFVVFDTSWSILKVKKIVALRKDGKYVEQGESNSISYVGKKEFGNYLQYDNDIHEEYMSNEKDAENARLKHNQIRKDIISKLKPVDISLYFTE